MCYTSVAGIDQFLNLLGIVPLFLRGNITTKEKDRFLMLRFEITELILDSR